MSVVNSDGPFITLNTLLTLAVNKRNCIFKTLNEKQN